MCGLVGIFDTKERAPIDRDLLTRMTDSLAHRGPDGDGFYVSEGIGLGHRVCVEHIFLAYLQADTLNLACQLFR